MISAFLVYGVLLLVLVLISILIYEPRKVKRIRRGQCSKCGYDMLPGRDTTCPECGHAWKDD